LALKFQESPKSSCPTREGLEATDAFSIECKMKTGMGFL